MSIRISEKRKLFLRFVFLSFVRRKLFSFCHFLFCFIQSINLPPPTFVIILEVVQVRSEWWENSREKHLLGNPKKPFWVVQLNFIFIFSSISDSVAWKRPRRSPLTFRTPKVWNFSTMTISGAMCKSDSVAICWTMPKLQCVWISMRHGNGVNDGTKWEKAKVTSVFIKQSKGPFLPLDSPYIIFSQSTRDVFVYFNCENERNAIELGDLTSLLIHPSFVLFSPFEMIILQSYIKCVCSTRKLVTVSQYNVVSTLWHSVGETEAICFNFISHFSSHWQQPLRTLSLVGNGNNVRRNLSFE